MRSSSVSRETIERLSGEILASPNAESARQPTLSLWRAFQAIEPCKDRHSISGKNGIAVAPAIAADCIWQDPERTRQFIRGLNSAIREARSRFHGETIRVIDAGCGPYASLAIAQTGSFSPQEVQFTLLEINEISARTAARTIEVLGLQEYFSQIITADAASYRHAGARPHVVVTETMYRALLREPQAAVTANLAPQMEKGGIFVPEEIVLRAYMQPSPGFPERDDSTVLGEIFRLAKSTNGAAVKAAFVLPEPMGMHDNLYVGTRVQATRDCAIEGGAAEITKPVRVMSVTKKDAGATIKFGYRPGEEKLAYSLRRKDGAFSRHCVSVTDDEDGQQHQAMIIAMARRKQRTC